MIAAALFCGMGMSALGVVRAGLDLRVGVDMNPAAIRAFNAQAILPPEVVGDVLQPAPAGDPSIVGPGLPPVFRGFPMSSI
jgi:hypothetical protein